MDRRVTRRGTWSSKLNNKNVLFREMLSLRAACVERDACDPESVTMRTIAAQGGGGPAAGVGAAGRAAGLRPGGAAPRGAGGAHSSQKKTFDSKGHWLRLWTPGQSTILQLVHTVVGSAEVSCSANESGSAVAAFFGREPIRPERPEEAVALGAALYAAEMQERRFAAG